MKRSELESKLAGFEDAKAVIDFIMAENGKDINAARSDYESIKTERDAAKAEHAKAVKELEEQIEKFKDFTDEKIKQFKAFDPQKLAELEKFKADTEAAATKQAKLDAVTKVLTENKASEKAVKLLIRGIDLDSLELDEKGGLKDSDKIVKPLKEEFAEYFVTSSKGGAPSGKKAPGTGGDEPIGLAGAIKAAYAEAK